MNNRYVILDGLAAHTTADYNPVVCPDFPSVESIADYCFDKGYSTAYILPGSFLFKSLKRRPQLALKETVWNIRPRTIGPVFTAWKKAGSRKVIVVAPGINDGYMWGLQDKKNLKEFRSILAKLIFYTGGCDITTPIGTARQVFDATQKVKTNSLLEKDADIFNEFKCQDLNYKRPLSGEQLGKLEKQYQHFVMIDRKHQYLSAAGVVPLGVDAAPEYNPEVGQGFNKRRAGVWRVKISKAGIDRFSDPFTGQIAMPDFYFFDFGVRHYYTPELELLLSDKPAGIQLTILESWTFPNSRRMLSGFAARMLDARQQAETDGCPDAGEVVDHLKAMYTRFFGWLAPTNPGPYSLVRPDWFFSIKAMAKANLIRNVYASHFSHFSEGLLLIGIRADCLCYLSNTPFTADFMPAFSRQKFTLERSGASGEILSIWNDFDRFHKIDDAINGKGRAALEGATE